MPTQTQVLDALRPVQDPELGRSIVDLDMVRDVRVGDGRVAVTVALTVAGCPLRAEITDRVTRAVQPLEGVRGVDVELTVMTDEERAALRHRIQGDRTQGERAPGGAAAAQGHGPSAPIPFADPSSRTRVIGLSSGKGGVGKSSVTVNLAVALRRRGHEVAVLDADVYGFSVPKMLGIAQDPVVIDGMIVPPVGHGVKVVSTGFFVGDDQPVIWRGPMLHKALEQFLTDVLWGEPDYLLVDMPPGTGDVALSLSQFMPRTEVFVVTTPQPAAQRVAQRSALMARKVNLPVRGVIENMSWFTGDDGKRYPIFGDGGGQSLAESLGVPLVARIPLVVALREGGDVGAPVTVVEPDGEASVAFDGLAERVAAMGPSRVYRSELRIT
ncbi:MAG TPA: Mrp/NBP35 family ATP-binding protein [Acidimicrobiales bacterium]|nr:Mrp/NBP35 family ATP-binding protein [Acidimicrobiales bacterium]